MLSTAVNVRSKSPAWQHWPTLPLASRAETNTLLTRLQTCCKQVATERDALHYLGDFLTELLRIAQDRSVQPSRADSPINWQDFSIPAVTNDVVDYNHEIDELLRANGSW